jgi:uncharacterized protein (TIGR02391 family)
MNITNLIPDPEALLAMPTSQLAGIVLGEMQKQGSGYKEHPGNFTGHQRFENYDAKFVTAVQIAMMEAFCFLVNEGFLIPEPANNTTSWHVLSRLAQSIKTKHDFSAFLHAKLFPKNSTHPVLTEQVYPLFMSGDYETAIFKAFKLVEVAVRDAAGTGYENFYGVDLMRRAFNPKTGPLTIQDEPESEKEAIMHLFAGAIGRFKNPSSHRHVPISDPKETIELLQFASHLLRVVGDRKRT